MKQAQASKRDEQDSNSYVILNAPRMKVSKLSGLKFPENCVLINLQDNELVSLDGMPTMKSLRYMQLDGNPIRSLVSVKVQPGLRWLSLRGAPITKNPYFTLMCLIGFGTNITVINKTKVDEHLRKMAKAMTHKLRPSIRQGFVISNLKPLRMYKPSAGRQTGGEKEVAKTTVAVLCDFLSCSDDVTSLPVDLKRRVAEKLQQIRAKHSMLPENETDQYNNDDETTDMNDNPFELSDDEDVIPPFCSDDD